jgi:hypothetical protein
MRTLVIGIGLLFVLGCGDTLPPGYKIEKDRPVRYRVLDHRGAGYALPANPWGGKQSREDAAKLAWQTAIQAETDKAVGELRDDLARAHVLERGYGPKGIHICGHRRGPCTLHYDAISLTNLLARIEALEDGENVTRKWQYDDSHWRTNSYFRNPDPDDIQIRTDGDKYECRDCGKLFEGLMGAWAHLCQCKE